MGEWVTRTVPWWETNVVHCALCGQMIPKAVWVSEEGLEFCGAACERLYHDYWIPRYGPKKART